jgi:hypothetical protein
MLSQRHHCRLQTKRVARCYEVVLGFFLFKIKLEKQISPEQVIRTRSRGTPYYLTLRDQDSQHHS